jgi:hypothetical protein
MADKKFYLFNPDYNFTVDPDPQDSDEELIQLVVPSTSCALALNPMTAVADIVVGGTAGIPTRLAKGTADQHLKMNGAGTALEWASEIATANPMSAAADLIVGGVAGAPARLAKGTAGQALCMDGTATAAAWTTINPMSAAADIIVGGVSGAVARLAKGAAGQALVMNSGATAQEWATVNAFATKAGVDLHTNAQHTATLNGGAAQLFVPVRIVVRATTIMTGDVQITVGTSAGGTQIKSATALTGLTAIDEVFVINLAGELPGIAGNGTVHFAVTTPDTSNPATGTVFIQGVLI